VLDFWQGHYANILGHNPEVVADALSGALALGKGLQTGHLGELQAEVAEILTQRTGAERVRFTTSGSLSSMYAMMLALASTGRDLILKVGGGWHGAQPWALKGIRYGEQGFRSLESLGLPANISTIQRTSQLPFALMEIASPASSSNLGWAQRASFQPHPNT